MHLVIYWCRWWNTWKWYMMYVERESPTFAHPTFAHWDNCSPDNCSHDNCSLRQLLTETITHWDNCSFDNCSPDNCSLRQLLTETITHPTFAHLTIAHSTIAHSTIRQLLTEIIAHSAVEDCFLCSWLREKAFYVPYRGKIGRGKVGMITFSRNVNSFDFLFYLI